MSIRPSKVAVAACVLLTAASGSSVQAHHSIAPFDRANPTELSGTVKEFRYINPHTRIYLMVSDVNGGETQWDLEGAAVTAVARQGWTSRTLQPGMKVRLLIAPRKDGEDGGEWMRLLEIDGKPFGGVR